MCLLFIPVETVQSSLNEVKKHVLEDLLSPGVGFLCLFCIKYHSDHSGRCILSLTRNFFFLF